MAMLLAMEGYDVRVAYDGPQALEAVSTARPEVILLDIGLPGMDGIQVAQRVRADPDNSSIVIVAVSGYGQEEHRSRSSQAGCDLPSGQADRARRRQRALASLQSAAAWGIAGKHRAPAQERRLAVLSPPGRRGARSKAPAARLIDSLPLSISSNK
jgi:CheY-like chemotaxis protein